MLMHPYRSDLEGKDLSGYSDPKGIFLFLESVKVCRDSGAGYISYMWQLKDDATKVVPKLSYVKEFKPWRWIIGTGIYTLDIKMELDRIQKNYFIVCGIILLIVAILQFMLVNRSKKIFYNKLAAEKAFKESEAKYKSIVENIQIGIARTTPGEKGECIELNSRLAETLGYTKEELKKIPVADLYLDNNKRKEFSKKISQLGIVKQEELELCKKNGAVIIVSATGHAIRDENGEIKFFDMILEDITNEKKSQEELLKSEKLISIGTLAGGIAHDFNNILTGLFGNIALA